ncbi:MAG TPA: hypothetical protein VEH29_08310, partial [Acidimicrobiales bacterium]|nr:hypothetical protein [Acidimicrobiales bacterium]
MGWLQRLLGREALSAVQPGDAAAAREPSWQQLAPIEGTFTPAELTLRPARFEAELTTRQSPAVIGPMLHDVSIDGLPGYVEASAQPLGSDPPAEGTVRFPSPPPSLSRLGTSSETPPVPPETPPRLLPSLPAPPPGASLLDAGGVSLETMRIEVHDAPVPPSLADATTRATGDAAGWPTSAPSSPASGGTTEGVPAPQVPAPSASLVGGVTPSLPAAGLSGHGRGTPGDSGAPASPTAATPAGQGAGLLPAAGSSTQPPGVRESDAAWRTPTAAPVAQRQAAPPLMAGFSTPAVAEPLAGASWSALLPTVQTSPRRHHEGTPEHLLDPPPPPVKQVPAAAPRRVQRYRLGEPETRSEFPGALPAAPSPSGLSPARPSRPPAAPPPAMQPRPASAPPPPAATQRDRGGFPASSRLQAPPASPRSVAPPPAPAPVSAPVPDSPLPPPSAGGVARPVAAPEPAPLTLTALGGEGAAGPSLGEQPGPPAPSPAPPLELVPPPAAASPPEAAYPLLTPITSAGRLPSSLPPPVSEV